MSRNSSKFFISFFFWQLIIHDSSKLQSVNNASLHTQFLSTWYIPCGLSECVCVVDTKIIWWTVVILCLAALKSRFPARSFINNGCMPFFRQVWRLEELVYSKSIKHSMSWSPVPFSSAVVPCLKSNIFGVFLPSVPSIPEDELPNLRDLYCGCHSPSIREHLQSRIWSWKVY